MKQHITTLILDFDDTLCDFTAVRTKIADFLDAFCKRKYGVEGFGKLIDELDTEMTIIARTKKDPQLDNRGLWAKIAGKRLGLDLTNTQCQEIRKIYWKIALEKTKLLPYTKEVLRKLAKKYKLFILSDADGETAAEKISRIKKLGIYKFFKGAVFGDAIGTTKPDIKFYTYLIKKYKIKPKESVMVGDKPQYDLAPAKELGITTVWLKHGRWATMQRARKFPYVDYRVTQLSQLLRILE